MLENDRKKEENFIDNDDIGMDSEEMNNEQIRQQRLLHFQVSLDSAAETTSNSVHHITLHRMRIKRELIDYFLLNKVCIYSTLHINFTIFIFYVSIVHISYAVMFIES